MRRGTKPVCVAAGAVLLALLLPATGRCQQPPRKRSFLLLYWYNKDTPGNKEFDSQFQADVLSRLPAGAEFYSEYLEDNRFPGENQSVFLRDFLRQKYAGRPIDVVITNTPPPLAFLFENRDVLFPRAPIVFANIAFPAPEDLAYRPGATGVIYAMTHRQTLELALRLHPDTEQVFVVNGAIEGDQAAKRPRAGSSRHSRQGSVPRLDGSSAAGAHRQLQELAPEVNRPLRPASRS